MKVLVLARPRLAAPCCGVHCVPTAAHVQLVSCKNVLEKAVQIISFIKSWPFSACYLNFLSDEIGGIHKALQLNTDRVLGILMIFLGIIIGPI